MKSQLSRHFEPEAEGSEIPDENPANGIFGKYSPHLLIIRIEPIILVLGDRIFFLGDLMMKHALFCLMLGLMSCVAGVANASSVSYAMNLNPSGSSGVITLAAPGSLTAGTVSSALSGVFNAGSVTLTVDIDGTNIGTFNGTAISGLNVFTPITFTIPQALLNSLTSDSSITFGAVLSGAGVVSANTYAYGGNLSYTAVPEPTSMAILGAGACGLFGFARRRRKEVC